MPRARRSSSRHIRCRRCPDLKLSRRASRSGSFTGPSKCSTTGNRPEHPFRSPGQRRPSAASPHPREKPGAAPQVRREMKFIMSPLMVHPHIVRGLAAFQDSTALYLVQVFISDAVTTRKLRRPACSCGHRMARVLGDPTTAGIRGARRPVRCGDTIPEAAAAREGRQ